MANHLTIAKAFSIAIILIKYCLDYLEDLLKSDSDKLLAIAHYNYVT